MSNQMKMMFGSRGKLMRQLENQKDWDVHGQVNDNDPRIDAVGSAYIKSQPSERKDRHRQKKPQVFLGYGIFRDATPRSVPRKGKTKKDHASGAHARRHGNQSLRAAWQADKGKSNDTFPVSAARGNGNSSKRRKYYG